MRDTTTAILESPLNERHRAAGAKLAPYFGVMLPEAFSSFEDEYRIARESVVLVDTNFRAVFSLTGPDRARYLNAVLSSNVRDLTEGKGVVGLLLNSQGHILAELETLACADELLVLGHEMVRQKTAETLDKFIIMDDATVSDKTSQFATSAVEGALAAEVVKELTGIDLTKMQQRDHVTAQAKQAVGSIPCRVIRHSLYGWPGAEFLVSRSDIGALWDALSGAVKRHGGGPIGYRALNILRLEAGVPWFGTDFDERNIPHEAALDRSHIDYTKGCYTGQEIVERVRSRGQVSRRLSGLRFHAANPPAVGTALAAEGAEAGMATSATFSPLLGEPIGFGYVRREHNQAGSQLSCEGNRAEVIELPLAGALSQKS